MKQIIVLERTDNNRFTVAFWLDVPVARRPFYADATATSAYKQASAAEITAIQTGAVKEQTGDFSFPGALTIANIQALLIAEFTARQLAVNNFNPWNRYGTNFDGTVWTVAGVV